METLFWTTVVLVIVAYSWDYKSPNPLLLFFAFITGFFFAIGATLWTYNFLGRGFFAKLVAGGMAVAIIWVFFMFFSHRSGHDRDGRGWEDGGGE
jgi:hypothetical protein